MSKLLWLALIATLVALATAGTASACGMPIGEWGYICF
jgi:hypothetical protein